jgi:hypothetical protein
MGENKKTDSKLVIEGITDEGKPFRPSDWAERVSGRLATFHKQRIIYSPLLKPGMKDGNKCVFIDEKLKETNPELYNQLLEFAKRNKLKVGSSEPLE